MKSWSTPRSFRPSASRAKVHMHTSLHTHFTSQQHSTAHGTPPIASETYRGLISIDFGMFPCNEMQDEVQVSSGNGHLSLSIRIFCIQGKTIKGGSFFVLAFGKDEDREKVMHTRNKNTSCNHSIQPFFPIGHHHFKSRISFVAFQFILSFSLSRRILIYHMHPI